MSLIRPQFFSFNFFEGFPHSAPFAERLLASAAELPRFDFSWLQAVMQKGGKGDQLLSSWEDMPGRTHRWGRNADLEVSTQALEEMKLERQRMVQDHRLTQTEKGARFVDLDGDGSYSHGDGVLVAVQDGAPIDQDQAIREADEILGNFLKNKSYPADRQRGEYDRDMVKRSRLDKNEDGVISAAELMEGLTTPALGGNRRSLKVWIDANGNGKIEDGELHNPNAIPDSKLPGRTRSLEIARNGHDRYGNGAINARTSLNNPKFTGLESDEFELFIDENGNGKWDQDDLDGDYLRRALSGDLTEKDYDLDGNGNVADWERKVVDQKAAHLRYRFDDNGDGVVTVDEIANNGGRILHNGRKVLTFSEFAALFDGQVRLDADVYTVNIQGKPVSVSQIDMSAIDRDVETLFQAIDGWGTDEDAINKVLAHRSNFEIELIKLRYQQLKGESLYSALDGDTSGDYWETLKKLLDADRNEGPADPAQARHDADVIRRAVKGWGTDEGAIIEVLTRSSRAHIEEIKKAYRAQHGRDLWADIDDDTSGDFRDLLRELVNG